MQSLELHLIGSTFFSPSTSLSPSPSSSLLFNFICPPLPKIPSPAIRHSFADYALSSVSSPHPPIPPWLLQNPLRSSPSITSRLPPIRHREETVRRGQSPSTHWQLSAPTMTLPPQIPPSDLSNPALHLHRILRRAITDRPASPP